MNKETIWQDVSFIISSEYRKKVLEKVETPKMPSQISKDIDINIAHVSRALTELESKKLVVCLTPESNKGKIYSITEYGKRVLSRSKEIR